MTGGRHNYIGLLVWTEGSNGGLTGSKSVTQIHAEITRNFLLHQTENNRSSKTRNSIKQITYPSCDQMPSKNPPTIICWILVSEDFLYDRNKFLKWQTYAVLFNLDVSCRKQ